MYLFPKPAFITNYHQHGGLKHHACILLQFRWPGVQNQFLSAKVKVSEGCAFSGVSREGTVSWAFPVSGGFWHLLLPGPFVSLQSFQFSIFKSPSVSVTLTLTPFSLLQTSPDSS